jgi:transposase
MSKMKDLMGEKSFAEYHDDPFEGLDRRRRGISKMEERHKDWILGARHALKHCGKEVVTSDDLHRVFPPPAGMHPNAIGAVFNTVEFTKLNEFVRSSRPEAHGRVIQKWRIKR